jgi:hypothetical protein
MPDSLFYPEYMKNVREDCIHAFFCPTGRTGEGDDQAVADKAGYATG